VSTLKRPFIGRRASGKVLKNAGCGFVTLVLIGVAIGLLLLVSSWASMPGRTDFLLHESRYQAIFQAAAAQGIRMGEQREFFLNDPSSPESLQAVDPNETADCGTGTGTVWIRRTGKNAYIVSILVADLGHAGLYGYLYSDVPLSVISDDSDATINAPGPMRQVQMQLNEHWWVIYNDLQ
jgi:hypothetical protein